MTLFNTTYANIIRNTTISGTEAASATMTKANITVAIAPETPTTGKDTKTFIMHKLWLPNHAPVSKHSEKKFLSKVI